MEDLRETIMEHIKNQHSLSATQISLLQERLSHIVSQFHTPDHPPYAAMIHRAILELKQKGGSTEKSISEFIRREYDDLPFAHCTLLKHHLGLLSENREITVSRGCRYSVCGAGSSKGGKKHRKKKGRWKFERKRNKKLKLVIRVNGQNPLVAGNDVIDTEKGRKGGVETPEQEIGTPPLQLTDGGHGLEDDICSRSKAMDIDPPLPVLTDGHEKLHNTSDLHEMELQAWNPNEDAIHELSSPERPPGFEFMGVNSPPRPVAEELKKADPPCPLQPIQEKKQEKKKGKHPGWRRLDTMLGEKEIVLALPLSQDWSPMQNDRSRRQFRRWNGDLPDISHTEKVSSSSQNSEVEKSRVETTSEVEKSRVVKKHPLKFTIITRRKAKDTSFQISSDARPLPVSPSLYPSMDLQQDEGSNSAGVCHSTQLSKLPQQDEDVPLKKYQRRGRRPKAPTLQDKLADIQKQQAEEPPKLLCYHILQEETSEATPTKEGNPEKDQQLEASKPRLRARPGKRNLVIDKIKDEQSSPRNKLIKRSKRNVRVHI